MDNRHKAMFDYISECPALHLFYFNFSASEPDASAISVIDGETVLKTDICGNRTIAYDFAVICYRNYSTENEENIEHMQEVQDFMAWIDEQDRLRHYPDFAGVMVEKIENLQNMPSVAGQDQGRKLAKYMFQVRVTYTE